MDHLNRKKSLQFMSVQLPSALLTPGVVTGTERVHTTGPGVGSVILGPESLNLLPAWSEEDTPPGFA